MRRSGPVARRPPEAVPPARGKGPARQPGAEVEAQAALLLIGAALLLRLLQSRRLWERLAVGAIVLRALGQIGQENGAGMMERLAAWNKQQTERFERQAERQAQHLQRQAERQGKRLVRKAKGPLAWKP